MGWISDKTLSFCAVKLTAIWMVTENSPTPISHRTPIHGSRPAGVLVTKVRNGGGDRDKLNHHHRTGTRAAGHDHQGSSEGHTNVHEYG